MYRILVICLAVSCLAYAPAKAVMVFSDRTAWEAALGGAPLVQDNFDVDITNAQSIVLASGVQSTSSRPEFDNNNVTGGRYDGDVELFDGASGAETISWLFPISINAFGADWMSTTSGDLLQITGNFDGSGNQTVKFSDFLTGNGDGFLGLIGDSLFQQITFSSETLTVSGERFQADNLAFAAVPLPATFPLLAGAIALLGIAARRSRPRRERMRNE